MDYVNSIRFRKANTYLAGTDIVILAIMFSVGFNSLSSNKWIFKYETGRTP